QLTNVTGSYGLSFVVAAFNSLIAWADVAKSTTIGKRLGIIVSVAALILLVMFVGEKFVPKGVANHSARAVQPNFPEVESYGQDWFGVHREDLAELERSEER